MTTTIYSDNSEMTEAEDGDNYDVMDIVKKYALTKNGIVKIYGGNWLRIVSFPCNVYVWLASNLLVNKIRYKSRAVKLK